MKLSIKERLILLNILPAQETYANLRIVQELKNELGFSEQDYAYLELVEDNGDVSWNPDRKVEKDIRIGIAAFEVIKKAFRKLDLDKTLTLDMLPAYERFTEDDPSVDTEVVDIDNARTG